MKFAFSNTDFSIMLNAAKVRPEAQERMIFEIVPLQSRQNPPSCKSFFVQLSLHIGFEICLKIKF